jgi:hypothetical protein
VVCSSFRARASAGEQTATAVGRCPFPVTMSAPRTRGSYDAARTDGGVIPCLGLDSLWRILKKRRVDQYKRMQLNPEATFAAVTHLLCSRPPAVQPNGALGLFSLTSSRSLCRCYHVSCMPPLPLALFSHSATDLRSIPSTAQPRSHHPCHVHQGQLAHLPNGEGPSAAAVRLSHRNHSWCTYLLEKFTQSGEICCLTT